MSFYSRYSCDRCGATYQSEGMSAHEVSPITHLRREARSKGWSVGKEKIMCDACRTQKRLTRQQAKSVQ